MKFYFKLHSCDDCVLDYRPTDNPLIKNFSEFVHDSETSWIPRIYMVVASYKMQVEIAKDYCSNDVPTSIGSTSQFQLDETATHRDDRIVDLTSGETIEDPKLTHSSFFCYRVSRKKGRQKRGKK